MSQAVIPLEPNRLLEPSTLGLTQLQALLAEAAIFVKSGLLPSSVNTPEKAVLIMAAGHELGIPKTYALRNIHVIQGRPTCSAELMMALVQRDHGREAIRVVETDEQHCTVVVRDGAHSCRFTWAMADAQRAGLANKDTWKQYPRAMLRSRAVSEACRATFPGSIGGLYTPDELGAEVRVGPDDAIDVVPQPSQLAALPPRPEAAPPVATPSPSSAGAPATTTGARGGGAIPLRTASEFFAAAHGLLGGNRHGLADRITALLGQEAGAFKQATGLATWGQVYDVLAGRYEDSQQRADPEEAIEPLGVHWPEDAPPVDEADEAAEHVRREDLPARPVAMPADLGSRHAAF